MATTDKKPFADALASLLADYCNEPKQKLIGEIELALELLEEENDEEDEQEEGKEAGD